MNTARFRVLDSCRGLCAVAVVLFHMDVYTHWYWLAFVRNGYAAVDFFFVLSGFVIASAYHAKLRTFVDAGRYMLRRFGRLYPLHIAVLLVYLAIELCRLFAFRADDAFADNTSLRALVEQILLVQGFTANHESWNYPAWSISVELWTNAAFGLLAVWTGQRLLTTLLIVATAIGCFIGFSDQIPFAVSPESADALLDAVHAVFEFCLGVFSYASFAALRKRGWKPMRLAELVVVPLAIGSFEYAGALPALGLPFAFAIVVFILAFEAGPLSAALLHPALRKLGTISYSVYLTHSLYLLALTRIVTALAHYWGVMASVTAADGDDLLVFGGRWAMDGASLACIAAVLIGSSLTYRFIEEPARKFFNRLSEEDRRQDQQASTAQSRA